MTASTIRLDRSVRNIPGLMRFTVARMIVLRATHVARSTPRFRCNRRQAIGTRPNLSIYFAKNRSKTLRVICSVKRSRRLRPMTHSQLAAVTTSPLPLFMCTSMPAP